MICAQTQNSIFIYSGHTITMFIVKQVIQPAVWLCITQIKVIDYFSETDGTWNMRELLYMTVIHTYH